MQKIPVCSRSLSCILPGEGRSFFAPSIVKERRCKTMKTAGVGLGMVGGMALAVTAMNALYPDVWRRMKRDGKRAARAIKRSSLLK